MPCPTPRRRGLALLVLSLATAICARAADVTDPWMLLGELRDNLEATTMRAGFVQIYQPAGFSSGDRETGYLYLSLPACVRWDYEEPYPKTFLLCENTIHTWNPGEQAGRRFLFPESDEPGIDLLRLQLEDLRQRYDGRVEEREDGSLEIILSPRSESPAIVEARVTMDDQRRELTNLSYRDLEGNVSRFEIMGYVPVDASDRFEVPEGLDWLDQ